MRRCGLASPRSSARLRRRDWLTATRGPAIATKRTSAATAAPRPATTGRRRHHRQSRAGAPIGRARIGSPARNRASSSASACAEAYRSRRLLFQALQADRLEVAIEIDGLSRRGETGSSLKTWITVSIAVAAWNGGRPVTRA